MKSTEELSLAEKKSSSNSNDYSNITKKFQDINLDDVDCQEQPINYSLKYPEESSLHSNFRPHNCFREPQSSHMENSDVSSTIQSITKSECRLETQSPLYAAVSININIPQKGLTYDSYAETDMDNLDQPIDYSRKYHEYDDYNQNMAFNSSSHHLHYLSKDSAKLAYSYEDTVKIFCTEDTPLNFSSASSLTDLREVGLSGLQTPNSCFEENLEKNVVSSHILKEEENASDSSKTQYLSTVIEDKELINEPSANSLIQNEIEDSNAENQALKIDTEENANDTPLMFSRTSSLCSLNSFEQHSIHDDQSSASDISQMTSGAISPSDLPDSPPCCAPKTSKMNDRLLFFPSSLSPLNLEDEVLPLNEELLNFSDDNSSHFEQSTLQQNIEKSVLSFPEDISSNMFYIHNKETGDLKYEPSVQYSVVPIELNETKANNFHIETSNVNCDRSVSEQNKQSHGEKSCTIVNSETSNSDRAILEKFIQLGMPKKKNKLILNKNKTDIVNNSPPKLQEMKAQFLDQSSARSDDLRPESSEKYPPVPFNPKNNDDQETQSFVNSEIVNVKLDKTEQSSTQESSQIFNSETSSSDRAILEKFIQLGMPKKKANNLVPDKSKINFVNDSSPKPRENEVVDHGSSEEILYKSSDCSLNTETSDSDKAILEKYIRLGMPKAKGNPKKGYS